LLLQGFGEMFLAIDKGYFKQVHNLLIDSSWMTFIMFVMQNWKGGKNIWDKLFSL
jgi:hypothetical protein